MWDTIDRVRADRRIGRLSTAAGGGWGPRHGPCAAAARARLGRGPSVLPPGPSLGPAVRYGRATAPGIDLKTTRKTTQKTTRCTALYRVVPRCTARSERTAF